MVRECLLAKVIKIHVIILVLVALQRHSELGVGTTFRILLTLAPQTAVH